MRHPKTMKPLSPKVALFGPAIITLAMLLVQFFAPVSLVPGIVYFLPVLFYLMGQATLRYVNRLEARLAALEQRLAAKPD